MLTVNPDFNTSLPNYIYDPKWWVKDGKPVSCWYPLIYALLIDKVTGTMTTDDGYRAGIVLGGAPVSFTEISSALGCSYSTVQRATKYLSEAGLIHRQLVSLKDGYRYFVLNCRKEFKDDETTTSIHKGGKYRKVEEREREFLEA